MHQVYRPFRFGQIKPSGWIRKQMEDDLIHGFVGRLDEILPDLIVQDDIYCRDRVTPQTGQKDVGSNEMAEGVQIEFMWWNSETQSNWRDGMVRHAALLDNPEYLAKAKMYVEHILAWQDEDGYLGIYAPQLRFHFTSENGELWAASSLYRWLLAYYEATGDERVLQAVRRAVDVVMRAYPKGACRPFLSEVSAGGVCHGLTFTDCLYRLYLLTGEEEYLSYAVFLYQSFDGEDVREHDACLRNLEREDYRFESHGVHTYEHLRSLALAAYASQDGRIRRGLDSFLHKMESCITPSGGPIGDEYIGGREADASSTGYEYCSLQELLDSYSLLMQLSGDLSYADRMEHLLFNAAQGARHPAESAICYLKTDNAYRMRGCAPGETPQEGSVLGRYKYSPTHQDTAACCVPNAGRIYPYYLQSMWLEGKDGLTCALYGASRFEGTIGGQRFCVTQETAYPFETSVTFHVETESPVRATLRLRVPAWATGVQVTGVESVVEEGCVVIQREWRMGDGFTVSFEARIEARQDLRGDFYLQAGPLVYALPIEGKETQGRCYPASGFRDVGYDSVGEDYLHYRFDPARLASFTLHHCTETASWPWDGALSLEGEFYQEKEQAYRRLSLVPMGGTNLRRVTFPKK